ncbi:ComF family protein [Altererythrobacter xixiisoli]|uniref:ComF family protein n=2 Tax=Croceibacterium xixiisoli TaxID=1476466 RepID=A0A6I4TZD8_9SPHN|nr:ComF family protein [Croceibacterium xixiisoli]
MSPRTRAVLASAAQARQFGNVISSFDPTSAFRPLVDLIYPPRCPSCGAGIAAQDGLCAVCWLALIQPGQPWCSTCQRPLPSTAGADAQCGPCMAEPPRHAGIAAATLYNDASRKLVIAFKHGRRIAMAAMLARMMAARLPAMDGDWLIVPVPLHWRRLWHRGFNQSALLARQIARLKSQRLLVDGLLRTRPTPMLGGLGRSARARALSGAITVNPRRTAFLRQARILLVDDVLTSGATTTACVSALRRAGAEQVVISCFARVLSETEKT